MGIVTLLSILAHDAIALPLSPGFPVGELKYIMDNSGASVLLATERYGDKAREVLGAGLDNQIVLDVREKILHGGSVSEKVSLEEFGQGLKGGMMLYTSGTTNRPVCLLFLYICDGGG